MGVHFHSQFRNPLAYPAGYAPGFDPNHVAARKPRFSGVALGQNFVSILQGRPGVITGTPTGSFHAGIGAGLNFNTAGNADVIAFAGLATAAPAITLAAIAVWDGDGSNIWYAVTDGSDCSLAINSTSLVFNRFGGTSHNVNVSLAANVPYLLIVSSDNSTFTNFLAKRLDTGSVITGSTAGAASPGGAGNVKVGNNPVNNRGWHGLVAAAMISICPLSLVEMLQWAADPWSFWYPNPGDNWIAAQAAAAFPYWAAQNNNFVIGTGIQ